MSAFHKTKLAAGAGVVLLAFAGAANVAHATTMTVGITIYQGHNPNPGSEFDSSQEADQGNSLITSGNQVYFGSYTGDVNFNPGSTNSLDAFFNSGAGTLTGPLGAASSNLISTSSFDFTTVMVFTGNTNGFTWGGTINHDDGITLYNGNPISSVNVGSADPTVDIPTGFSNLSGPWTLIYVESNGLPAVLDFEVTSVIQNNPGPTPLPAALPLFATGLGAMGLLGWRRKRKTTAA